MIFEMQKNTKQTDPERSGNEAEGKRRFIPCFMHKFMPNGLKKETTAAIINVEFVEKCHKIHGM